MEYGYRQNLYVDVKQSTDDLKIMCSHINVTRTLSKVLNDKSKSQKLDVF